MRGYSFAGSLARAPEDGQGAGQTGGAPPPAAAGAADTGVDKAAPPVADAGKGGGGQPYRPEGLPDHLFGASEKETIDKLWGATKGFRDAQAQRGELPKEAAGYAFEPSEPLKPYAPGLDKDPLWGVTREAALKHGLTTKQFNGFMNDVMGAMVAGGGALEPYSAEKELAALLPDVTDPGQRKVQGEKLSRDALALLDAFAAKGAPQDAIEFMKLNADRAVAIKFVNWIGAQGGAADMKPALGGGPGGAVTREELQARQADPRNQYDSGKYDPAYAARTAEMYQAFEAAKTRA